MSKPSAACECAAEGLCVVAREQSPVAAVSNVSGFRQKTRVLYFSIIFRPQFEQNTWSLLTLMAAVAVSDALREACSLETDIKWPNDILANDRKLCGILAETVETPLGRAVVVGIGINLTKRSFPEELELVATSVETASGRSHDLETLLGALIVALEKHCVARRGPMVRKNHSRVVRALSYAEGRLIRVIESNETLGEQHADLNAMVRCV